AAATGQARRRGEVAVRRELIAGRMTVNTSENRPKPSASARPAHSTSSRQPPAQASAPVPDRRAGARAASNGASSLPGLGYAGLVAYAQMTRVAILRELERGEPGSEALQRQLEAHLESLQSNLQPLLDELAALPSADSPRKAQLVETAEGVRRSVETLSGDLGALPWPAAPEQQKAFAATIARLYDRLKPLQDRLDAVTAHLRPIQPRSRANQRGRSQSKARPPLAPETGPGASTVS
ncbi:MAG: hypothetical protein RMK84_01105, partial [Oscillochloridaceae bacterium]|nr:hypothetical protein [Chloroflexaceae bacterium]MDW8388696.1 hypothetical protein [Oscillochloridaceae bacterium]